MTAPLHPEIAAIDRAFGAMIARTASQPQSATAGTVDLVTRAAILVSAERARGNSCVDLAAVTAMAGGDADAGNAIPPLADWLEALRQSGVCDDGSGTAPLVLDGTRLYLRRFFAAETRLAAAIRERLAAQAPDQVAPVADTITLFRQLFPASDQQPDWQAVAAAAALGSGLLCITGGPGTGKTTVAARILTLLLQQNPALHIALAAPTGRAAARLAEAIAGASARIEAITPIGAALPRQGTTLHRLLGYTPWNDRYRHGPRNRLAYDVIVLDEASMIDLLLMDAFFAALRPDTRVIILGDPDQLVSVETGFVLGDIAQAAAASGDACSPALAGRVAHLTGSTIASSPAAPRLRDAVVRLRHSYRFAAQAGIGALAASVLRADGPAACAVLDDAGYPDVARLDAVQRSQELLAPVVDDMVTFTSAASPGDALAALAHFRILCAVREGPFGVSGINAAAERWLVSRGRSVSGWYDHRPVLVTANDPATQLYNGDVGVTLTVEGRTAVWFSDGHGGVRGIAPSRLPAHETAWAMTVHKAQGSEFTRVVLVLPEQESRILTRELLYTGITRVRETLTIIGSREAIVLASARSVARASGLAARLGAPVEPPAR